jgi:hypothetical protein
MSLTRHSEWRPRYRYPFLEERMVHVVHSAACYVAAGTERAQVGVRPHYVRARISRAGDIRENAESTIAVGHSPTHKPRRLYAQKPYQLRLLQYGHTPYLVRTPRRRGREPLP